MDVRRLFVAAVALAVSVLAFRPMNDPDFFWHLKVGQWIIEHAAIPSHDLFTYTVSSHPFVAHEWLSEVLMTAIHSTVGVAGVTALFGLVTLAGFMLLWRSMIGVPFVLGGVTVVLAAAAGSPVWGPRTQMLTFTFSVVLLLLLRRHRDSGDRRWLYAIPPMFLLWVNLHAGYTIGLVILTVHVVGAVLESTSGPSRVRPLLAVLALSTVAATINPNLVGIFPYALQTQFSSAQQRLILEWESPDFHLTELRVFELMLGVLVAALALSPRKPRATDLLLVLLGLALALQSVRHIALFVALVTPVLGEQLAAAYERLQARGLRLREPPASVTFGIINSVALLLVAVTVLGGRVVPAATSDLRSPAVTVDFPVAAMDAIQSDLPPGRVFNNYNWGGYLIHREWPAAKVFIYGDAAVMGDDFLREYEAVSFLHPDWQQILDRYQVGWVIDRSESPLTQVLQQAGWSLRYRDRLAMVLVRPTR